MGGVYRLGRQAGENLGLWGTEAGAARSNAEIMASTKEAQATMSGPADYSALSETVASMSRENEKELDKLFKKLGETGDYAGAIKAAEGFHETTIKQADLEKEIFKYSATPEYHGNRTRNESIG